MPNIKKKPKHPDPRRRVSAIRRGLEQAVQHYRAGRLAEADSLCKQVLQAAHNQPDALNLLGVIAQQEGRNKDAVKLISRAVAVKPDLAGGYNNLGSALWRLDRLEEAAYSYRKAVELKPNYAYAYYNLGCVLRALDRVEQAVRVFRKAIALNSELGDAHYHLGVSLAHLGKLSEAVQSYRRAIVIKPRFAEAHGNLGTALKELGNMEEAVKSYRDAIAVNPHIPEAYNNLGSALTELGEVAEGQKCYQRALDEKPDYASAHSNLLFNIHYDADITRDALFQAHLEWNRRHARAVVPFELRTPGDPDKQPLTVGLVSKCFHRHPAMWLSVAGLEALNPRRVGLIAYAHMKPAKEDEFSERLRRACRTWRPIEHLSDAEAAKQIRADGVDILIDMSGHNQSRLLICAHRAAPVQLKWVGGQFNTTGMEAMDWMLADAVEVPPRRRQLVHRKDLPNAGRLRGLLATRDPASSRASPGSRERSRHFRLLQ